MKFLLWLISWTAVLAGNSSALADDPGKSSFEMRADLPYQGERSEPITHEIDFHAVVTPPYHCKTLKVWLPLPQSDACQEVSASDFSTFPVHVEPRIEVEPVYGNKFAYFEFHDPHGAQMIRHRFQAKVWQMNWKVDPSAVRNVAQWPEDFAPYRTSSPLAERRDFDGLIRSLTSPQRKAGPRLLAAMDWIDANLTYDHVDASLQADAEHAFSKRHGHCSDYHGLCATMGRALGLPTRVTYGLGLVPKNSPSHCKLEAFLPPYGWVSFDLSETQKLTAIIQGDEDLSGDERIRLAQRAVERLHRGFRENSWLLVTRGTDYELAPPASKPVRVVRTIYAEADGEPLPEPDPANREKHEFSWMTAHKYAADKPFRLPFKDLTTLQE